MSAETEGSDNVKERRQSPESEYLHISESHGRNFNVAEWIFKELHEVRSTEQYATWRLASVALALAWSPLQVYHWIGWGQRRPVIKSGADNKLREITNTRDDRIKFKSILISWSSGWSLRRWHLIKINVIFCAWVRKRMVQRVKKGDLKAWTAEWVKAWEAFHQLWRLMWASRLMSHCWSWYEPGCIHQYRIHPRRRHTISQAQLTDHTSEGGWQAEVG